MYRYTFSYKKLHAYAYIESKRFHNKKTWNNVERFYFISSDEKFYAFKIDLKIYKKNKSLIKNNRSLINEEILNKYT